jgi:ABC-type nitrate/sulfonate/bicarbonate transport system substrate-binding protein
MSNLNQPLFIANSSYHVGHQIAIGVAEEQGFFRQEGLIDYVYDGRGLIPAALESEGLGLAMTDRGVDIATAVDVHAAVVQRARGADLFVVSGWRYTPGGLKWYSAKHITDIRQLRGGKIGVRERDGLSQIFITEALQNAGIDPEADVEWVFDPVFAYHNDERHLDMLRSGKIDALTSRPPFSRQLEEEGYPLLLDPNVVFNKRPGKVVVATKQTITNRGPELRAFLRARMRTFWFMRDLKNFDYLHDLEAKLRRATHNVEEQNLFIVTSTAKMERWALPIDQGVTVQSMERIIGQMLASGELTKKITANDVLDDTFASAAYSDISNRPELRSNLEQALATQEKYGF